MHVSSPARELASRCSTPGAHPERLRLEPARGRRRIPTDDCLQLRSRPRRPATHATARERAPARRRTRRHAPRDVWLSRLPPGTSYLTGIALPMALIGIGQGGTLAPPTAAGIAGVGGDDAGALPESSM